jgi:uncharacterized protein (DUF4415 family)
VEISFDPSKGARNISERGLSFERAAELDFLHAIVLMDERATMARRLPALAGVHADGSRDLPSAAVGRITIRLSRDVVSRCRASGEGWQRRVDKALRKWRKRYSPAP